jgi:threonine dehydratase
MTITTAKHPPTPNAQTPKHDAILAQQKKLTPWIVTTPVWQLPSHKAEPLTGSKGAVFLKLECWQHTGTFKVRGALTQMMALSKAQHKKGVVAMSAGNHAIATSYAAKCFNSHAKVLMPRSACPHKIKQCRAYGGDILFKSSMQDLFDQAQIIQQEEDRALIHPFDGPHVALGTATLGAELCQQIPKLDAVIIAVGGGGLLAGCACAIKQWQPNCAVYGVEPTGANTMHLSFHSGKPEKIVKLNTIADSLSAPHSLAYSYALCARYADGLVSITDEQLRQAMALAYDLTNMALEPAACAALAALTGPLQPQLNNKRVALLICGSNIDIDSFATLLKPNK